MSCQSRIVSRFAQSQAKGFPAIPEGKFVCAWIGPRSEVDTITLIKGRNPDANELTANDWRNAIQIGVGAPYIGELEGPYTAIPTLSSIFASFDSALLPADGRPGPYLDICAADFLPTVLPRLRAPLRAFGSLSVESTSAANEEFQTAAFRLPRSTSVVGMKTLTDAYQLLVAAHVQGRRACALQIHNLTGVGAKYRIKAYAGVTEFELQAEASIGILGTIQLNISENIDYLVVEAHSDNVAGAGTGNAVGINASITAFDFPI